MNKIEQDSYFFGNPKEFEISPLDVNIAKIQFNLKNKCELQVPEAGIFNVVEEIYESKDPTLDLSTLKILYKNKSDDVNSSERCLLLKFQNKMKTLEEEHILLEGTKKEINSYINSIEFFKDIKRILLNKCRK